MHRYLLKISFDGTDYHGWQVQPNGITVQEQLQNSMKQLYGYAPAVTGCSRTDAGVHAIEFYCHFDLETAIEPDGVIRGLNSVLPQDIRAIDCKFVNSDFHARYNAVEKNYIYKVDRRTLTDPFNSRYSYNYSGKLNLEDIEFFCNSLIGTHDFIGFSSSGRSVKTTVRTISECSVKECGDFLVFSVTADGFLYNMVRIIVGTALAVGRGSVDREVAEEIFNSGDRNLAGATAPPQALFLNRVYY